MNDPNDRDSTNDYQGGAQDEEGTWLAWPNQGNDVQDDLDSTRGPLNDQDAEEDND